MAVGPGPSDGFSVGGYRSCPEPSILPRTECRAPSGRGPSGRGRHEVSPEQTRVLKNIASVLAAAARYTRTGVRSVNEVRAYLEGRKVPSPIAGRVIEELTARGFLDDRACARLWGEHWARRGYAWAAIRSKLSTKGLDERTIDEAAQHLGRPSQDDARARGVVAQRTHRSADRRERTRLARALASRGFDPDLIERVLSESFSSRPSDAER